MRETLANAEKAASERIHIEQGDYIGADGLLICGKCHTPKQGRYEMPWGEVTPYILCKCEAERRDREEAEKALRAKVERLKRNAFTEAKMRNWTFENDDHSNEKISTIAKNYFENFEEMKTQRKGLLFYGNVGTGKSYIAACIANALMEKGIPAYMRNFKEIDNALQDLIRGKQEYYDNLNRFPLLILDDLSAERKTEYMQEIVFNVIDSRYKVGLPLIVTTNLTADELKYPAEITNKRTFSRLFEMCIPIEVSGTDRRREVLKKDHGKYKDLLGL